MASPGRHQVVVEDVLLKSAFPELLPAGPTARLRVAVWWPTQTNRQGDGARSARTSSSEAESRLSTRKIAC